MNIGHHAVLEDETASVIVKTGDDLDACTTYFISPDKPMVGRGKRLSSADLCGMTPLEQMTAMFALAREEGRKPVVMGAIPFSEETRPALVLPCDVLYPSRTQVLTDKTTRHTNTAHFIDRIESERNYQKAVENGLTLIRQGMIDKIVLSRQLDLTATRNIDSLDVLRNLLQKHPASYVFSVPHCLSDNTQTGVFIGASPELLVRKHGDFVYANPLAGSVASHPDKAENEKRIAQLTASAKDQQEHRYTVRSVCDVLAQYCDDIVAPDQPEVLTAGPIHHLSSQIKGRLRYSTTTALDLARALHPTPAVGLSIKEYDQPYCPRRRQGARLLCWRGWVVQCRR